MQHSLRFGCAAEKKSAPPFDPSFRPCGRATILVASATLTNRDVPQRRGRRLLRPVSNTNWKIVDSGLVRHGRAAGWDELAEKTAAEPRTRVQPPSRMSGLRVTVHGVGKKGTGPCFRTRAVRANQADWPKNGPVPRHLVNGYGLRYQRFQRATGCASSGRMTSRANSSRVVGVVVSAERGWVARSRPVSTASYISTIKSAAFSLMALSSKCCRASCRVHLTYSIFGPRVSERIRATSSNDKSAGPWSSRTWRPVHF